MNNLLLLGIRSWTDDLAMALSVNVLKLRKRASWNTHD